MEYAEIDLDLDEEIKSLNEEINNKLGICCNKDDDSIDLEVRAKKKTAEPPTLDRLFKEKIWKYRYMKNSGPCAGSWDTDDSDTSDTTNLTEIAGTIKYACNEYLSIRRTDGEAFVLRPNGNDKSLSVGMNVYLLTESFEDCLFLVYGLPMEDYNKLTPVLNGLSLPEKADTLAKTKLDPDGFAIWGQLGSIKRKDTESPIDYKRRLEGRTKEFLKRIPLDRNDLYGALERALHRFCHCCSNEKADYAETLSSMERLMIMMLAEPKETERHLKIDDVNTLFPNASVKETALAGRRHDNAPPNILIVGRDSDRAISAMREYGCSVRTIDMAGVEGNDFLFGDQMSYYCSGIGRLVREYEEAGTLSAVIVLESVDLMGTSMRSSNPLYGVAKLLRNHRVQDFHLRDFEIDASRTQFICQVNDLESCLPLLLSEMDIIIEL